MDVDEADLGGGMVNETLREGGEGPTPPLPDEGDGSGRQTGLMLV
jgi:hypothetical protein